MNALEDTRELVTTTSTPTTLNDIRTNRSRFIAGFVDDLLYKYPDVELSTIRITELDGVITVTGRRGPLAPIECPQCHQAIGRPHTEFCTLAPDRVWPDAHDAARNAKRLVGGLRDAYERIDGDREPDASEASAPGHHLVHSEAFIDQDDPRSHPVGPRSRPGAHHAEDCPMRHGLVTTGCICGREGERDPKP